MSVAARRGMREVEVPRGVRRPDDPELVAPRARDDEEEALLGLGDQTGVGVDAVARHEHVHALARLHPELALAADHGLDLVGPDPGGVDGHRRAEGNSSPDSRSRATAPDGLVAVPDEGRDAVLEAMGARCLLTHHVTSPIGYVRLHGRNYDQWFEPEHPHDRYNYLYNEDELQGWKQKVQRIAQKAQITYVIANNHFEAKGAVNALQLKNADRTASSAPEVLLRHYPKLRSIADPLPDDFAQGPLPLLA